MKHKPLMILGKVELPHIDLRYVGENVFGDVVVKKLGRFKIAVCRERCPWHCDSELWTLLLVLKNTKRSYVEVADCKASKRQPAGTVLLLQPTEYHKLSCDDEASRGQWIAAIRDYERHPSPAMIRAQVKAWTGSEEIK